jgi:hypothetical protein
VAQVYVLHHMLFRFHINDDPNASIDGSINTFVSQAHKSNMRVIGRPHAIATPSLEDANAIDVMVRGAVTEKHDEATAQDISGRHTKEPTKAI